MQNNLSGKQEPRLAVKIQGSMSANEYG
jgi:hypothetical protein